jgi:pimeloyl-ACP methyl ester carboxylesterase
MRVILWTALGVLLALGAGVWWLWNPDQPVAALKGRWAPAPSQFMALDGMQVHFRDEGPRDDPVPIVLLHGTGSSLHTWEGWAAGLKDRRRVITLDRPGFGLTGPNPTGDYTMAYYVGFLDRFLNQLGVQKVVLAGNSSGGRMAWHFAATYPQRVTQLALLAPAGYPRTTPLPIGLRISMTPVLGPLVLHIAPPSAAESSVRGAYGDPGKVTPELVRRNTELASREGNRAALGSSLRQAHVDGDTARIRELRAPTLILWGSKDAVIPPDDGKRFIHDVRDSRLVILEGVGHLPQEEDAARSLAAFKDFLK